MNKKLDGISLEVSQLLITKKWLLVTAESCTGGLVASSLTKIPGSSIWFERGFVSYSNLSKQEMLGVKASTLKKWGAVSKQVVREMAEGALKNSAADVSIAITGIAGPSGGTKEKPVGTVWLAVAKKTGEVTAELHHYSGTRTEIQCIAAFDLLNYLKVCSLV